MACFKRLKQKSSVKSADPVSLKIGSKRQICKQNKIDHIIRMPESILVLFLISLEKLIYV